MAWMMKSIPSARLTPISRSWPVWLADEHDEVVELQDTGWVAVGVEDVVVVYAVFACAGQDHRFHGINLS